MAYQKEYIKTNNGGVYGCCFLTTIMLLICVFVSIIPLIYYYNLDQGMCNVTKVEYPESLPTTNNTDNWLRCNCGLKCRSWTPCIKIYVNNDDDFVLNDHSSSKLCTFYDSGCLNSDNVVVLQEQLRLSIIRAKSYINQTISCFYGDLNDNYYLNSNLDYSIVYTCLIFTILLLMITVILSITKIRNNRRPDNIYINDDSLYQSTYQSTY
jgi:uncharacterized membrane protein